uniref:Uncharacterized protein n=1 Tax=Zooxanthella nutricula TaxID=1333877 RepID=A0A7S2LAQ6_9DINO
MFLKYLRSLDDAPRLALSVIYPILARAILIRCVKGAMPFDDGSASGHLHKHQIGLLMAELIGEFLAKQSAYIAGGLLEIAIVLVSQACCEIAGMWAKHKVITPAQACARRWWARFLRTEGPAQEEPSAGAMLRRDFVLEAYMYDVRNSMEYLAHSCMPICVVVMGADPWLMLQAWAMGVCIEIATDLVGSQCRRLLNPCVLGVYTFDWPTELILTAFLMSLNMTNISAMQSIALSTWEC